MSVPAKRQSRSKTRRRRSHHHLSKVQLQSCSQCKSPIPTHQACPECGSYKGRQVMKMKSALKNK